VPAGAVCHYVNDIDRTAAFYRDVLGLAVQPMGSDSDGSSGLMAMTVNGVELLFIKQESRPGNTPIVVFEIAEGGIDDMVSELAGKGVTIVTPVSPAPGGWSAEFKDPEGHVLSMYQPADKPRKR
jgi:predicted enzyme related to lactoylglutathione lyase